MSESVVLDLAGVSLFLVIGIYFVLAGLLKWQPNRECDGSFEEMLGPTITPIFKISLGALLIVCGAVITLQRWLD